MKADTVQNCVNSWMHPLYQLSWYFREKALYGYAMPNNNAKEKWTSLIGLYK